MISQTNADNRQPSQQHKQAKSHTKAQTKDHTAQPPIQPTLAERVFVGIGTVIGWMLVPCIVVALVIYKVRVAKARMGYRTVTVERRDDPWR